MVALFQPLEERFWSKVQKTDRGRLAPGVALHRKSRSGGRASSTTHEARAIFGPVAQKEGPAGHLLRDVPDDLLADSCCLAALLLAPLQAVKATLGGALGWMGGRLYGRPGNPPRWTLYLWFGVGHLLTTWTGWGPR